MIGFSAVIFMMRNRLNNAQVLSSTEINTQDAGSVEHSSRLYEPQFFDQAYTRGKQYIKDHGAHVIGGIIPHHLLAAPLIAAFFEGIENQEVKKVLLIGPNHYNAGAHTIVSSKATWKTIFGDLQPDVQNINLLESEGVVFIDEEVFDNEHSIYGISPFIKKSFPSATFIPIILKGSASRNDGDRLVEALEKILDSNTVVLASVDFSHYLSSVEADGYDAQSIETIMSFNLDGILNLDYQKNLDSPVSIYALVKLMQNIKAIPVLIQNSNSAKQTNQMLLESTTSYVTMYFTEDDRP